MRENISTRPGYWRIFRVLFTETQHSTTPYVENSLFTSDISKTTAKSSRKSLGHHPQPIQPCTRYQINSLLVRREEDRSSRADSARSPHPPKQHQTSQSGQCRHHSTRKTSAWTVAVVQTHSRRKETTAASRRRPASHGW